MKHYGDKLNYWREKRGFSAQDFAEKLGVRAKKLLSWEATGNFDIALLPVIAKALKVPVTKLVRLSGRVAAAPKRRKTDKVVAEAPKKRGRPKKVVAEAPKKRGRPKKVVAGAPPVLPKRKPGRPKKVVDLAAEIARLQALQAEAVETPKRKPGRPKKVAAAPTQVEEIEDDFADGPDIDEENAVADAAVL